MTCSTIYYINSEFFGFGTFWKQALHFGSHHFQDSDDTHILVAPVLRLSPERANLATPELRFGFPSISSD
jgi:hypothetical protein